VGRKTTTPTPFWLVFSSTKANHPDHTCYTSLHTFPFDSTPIRARKSYRHFVRVHKKQIAHYIRARDALLAEKPVPKKATHFISSPLTTHQEIERVQPAPTAPFLEPIASSETFIKERTMEGGLAFALPLLAWLVIAPLCLFFLYRRETA
jgi:hypothetical protein